LITEEVIMHYIKLWLVMTLILAALQLAACSRTAAEAEEPGEENGPAQVEHLEGANPTRIVLTEEAAQRLALQTAPVREEQVKGTQRKVIPYAAVLYDSEGNTWTYTNSEPLTFVRQPIIVDRIEGDLAVLSDGPASGTAVVTDGAAELFGSELEFEEE
jgi:ABC-type Fe3+-hydroxamate transport system substrate-binding protein